MTALVIKTDSPVVAGPLQGHWTLADWEALPNDGNRYEIIDGVQLYVMITRDKAITKGRLTRICP